MPKEQPTITIEGVPKVSADAPEYNDSTIEYSDSSTLYSGVLGFTGTQPGVSISTLDQNIDAPQIGIEPTDGINEDVITYNDPVTQYSDPGEFYGGLFQSGQKPQVRIDAP